MPEIVRSRALPPRQQRAVDALLAGKTATEAASAAGVDPRTLRRWQALPVFSQAVDEGQKRLLDDLVHRLTDLSSLAVDVIEGILLSGAQPNVRLQAASRVLEHLLRMRDSVTFEARLAEVERRLAEVDHAEPKT